MFEMPEGDLFTGSLPGDVCTACRGAIPRRKHRVYIRATWRPQRESLCTSCWHLLCSWAGRFALRQLELGLELPD